MHTAWAYVILQMNNIAKLASTPNNGDRKMELNLFDSREDDEYNGVDFREIAKIVAMQDDCFLLWSGYIWRSI